MPRHGIVLLAGLLVVFASASMAVAQEDHGHMTPEGGMDSGDMHQGDTWEHTFNEEGTFHYLCHPHPYMTARIVVSHDAPMGNGTMDVRIADYAFEPDELHIRPGTTVRWTNEDPVVHTVTETEEDAEDTAESPASGAVAAFVAFVVVAVATAVWRRRGR